MHATLLAVALVNGLTVTVFASAGFYILRRRVAPIDLWAMRAMATWWISMAFVIGLQALETLVAAFDVTSIAASTTVRYLNGAFLALGAWGLCFHVLYLRTGRRVFAAVLAPFFLLIGGAYAATVALHPITNLRPAEWAMTETYAPPLEGDGLWTAVVAAVGLPIIVACVLYLLILPSLSRRDQRRRGALICAGILLWVVSGLVVEAAGDPFADFLTLSVFAVIGAAVVWLAYFPLPSWRRGDPLPDDGRPILRTARARNPALDH